MNEKGRQTKLLAAVAILAMVVCAFAVAMPSTDAASATQGNVILADNSTGVAVSDSFYYVDANTVATEGSADATITAPSTGAVTIFMEVGAVVNLPAVATANVNLYIGTWTQTAEATDDEPAKGTVSYNTNTKFDLTAVTDAVNITATAYGFTVDTPANITPGDNEVAYKFSTETTYYNPAMISSIGEFKLQFGSTLTFPVSVEDDDETATVDETKNVGGTFSIIGVHATDAVETEDIEIKFTDFNMGTTTAITVTVDGSSADQAPTIELGGGDGEETGTISMVKGTATLKDGFDFAQCLEGYTTGTEDLTFGNSLYAVEAVSSEGSNVLTQSVTGYGTINQSMTVVGATSAITFSLGNDSSTYSGTFTYKDAATATITQTVTLRASGTQESLVSVAATDGLITVNGTATSFTSSVTFVSDSNVTVSAITQVKESPGVADVITLNGVALNGSISAPVKVGTSGAVIPNGAVLTFQTGGKITTATSNANLTVLGDLRQGSGVTANSTQIINSAGYVYTNSLGMVTPYTSVDNSTNLVAITTAVEVTEGITEEQFLKLVQSGTPFILGDNIALNILTSVSVNNTTIYVPDGTAIFIGYTEGAIEEINSSYTVVNIGTGERGTLNLNNVTVYSDDGTDPDSAADGKTSIYVNARNGFSITDSMVFAVVDAPSNASVTVNNPDSLYENTTSGVLLGYGTNLTLSGNVSNNITVYGNIIINSDVTIPLNAELNVYNGATITINGKMTVTGAANFFDGSKTVVNGSINVYEEKVGAAMTVGINPYDDGTGTLEDNEKVKGADFTIASEGEVTISSVRNGYAGENKLIINNPSATYSNGAWDPRFLVLGTLTVDGTVSGIVHDQGTVAIDGKIGTSNATVVIYDGVSITVESVTGGTLTVSDDRIASESLRDGRDQSTGNNVVLDEVQDVVVTSSVQTVKWTDADTDKDITDYYTVMDVSGTITPVDEKSAGTVSLSGAGNGVGKNDRTYGKIAVTGAISLGRNVTLSFNGGNIDVSGTIDCLTDENKDGIEGSSMILNGANVTVTGHIQALEDTFTLDSGILNAVYYRIVGTGADADTIDHYVGFNAAIDAGLEAENDEVTVYGSVSATETIIIPEGLTVNMEIGADVSVPADIIVTLADGATLYGLSATVTVSGTFISENYDEDLSVGEVISDVVIDETPKMTWTSLANAIGMGMTEIILNGPLHITEDLTIPTGVTVSTNYEVNYDQDATDSYAIFVDDATLTVDGTLYMGEKTEGRIIFTDDGKMIVNGQFSARLMDDNFDSAENSKIYNIAGAHYIITDGAYDIYYITNIAIAAQTVSENANFDADNGVIIKGVLTAGDVSFTAAPDTTIDISFVPLGEEPDQITVVRMGTVTVENVDITIGDNCRVSGTIQSATASVALTNAANASIVSTDGEEPETEVSGAFTGTMEIAAGEASIYNSLTVGAESVLNVASGAVLNVPANTYLSVAASEDDNAVIDGTVNFVPADGLRGTGELLVNGTANVDTFTLATDMRVTGQLNVADGKTMTINGADLFVGDKPETLGQTATGAVSGAIVFTPLSANAIVAYNGADLSGAKIQVNSATGESEAAATVYNINGTAYMTVYTYEGDLTIAAGSTVDGAIDLVGWQAVVHWYAVQDYNTNTDKIVDADDVGEYANVYTTLLAENVFGVISKDAGIILTIDDLVVGTIGDVAQTIDDLPLSVGTHTIAWSERTGYNIENVTVTFNGQAVENGGTITITADMESYTIIAQGAVPGAAPGGDSGSSTASDDGLGLTDYLLIVLVILIVVMAIMVAVRLMRS